MTDSKFFDSSAWLAYFYANNEEIKSIVDSNILLFTSTISIFEIKKKLIKDKIDKIKIQRSLEFIKNRSLIVNIDSEISEKAVEISISNNLHTVDALIYISALENDSILITFDSDFKNLDNVLVLK